MLRGEVRIRKERRSRRSRRRAAAPAAVGVSNVDSWRLVHAGAAVAVDKEQREGQNAEGVENNGFALVSLSRRQGNGV